MKKKTKNEKGGFRLLDSSTLSLSTKPSIIESLSRHNHQYVRTPEQVQAEKQYLEWSKQWKDALNVLSTAEI